MARKSKRTKRTNQKNAVQSTNKNRQIALAILITGVVLAIVAGILLLSNQKPASPTGVAVNIDTPDGLATATLAGVKNKGTQPSQGKPAPNFALQYPNNKTLTLADFRGKPVIVNFWATWCPPCRREMPGLVKAYEAHKDEGLVIIEVDVAEPAEAVAQFVKDYQMTMPVVLDSRQEVTRLYRTDSFPTSFFIDKEGVIQARWVGYLPEDQLALNLTKIMP